MPMVLDMLHLGNRKPTSARAPIETALRQRPLNAVKIPRRHNYCRQKDYQFEDAVRKPRLRMQYLINLPFGLYGFPRPSAVDHEPNLVCSGLGVLDDGAAYLGGDAQLLTLLRHIACKHRQ